MVDRDDMQLQLYSKPGAPFWVQETLLGPIGLYRENAIAIQNESGYSNGGNV